MVTDNLAVRPLDQLWASSMAIHVKIQSQSVSRFKKS